MTLKVSPKAWSSVGGAVCFVLADVASPAVPLEVTIESPLKPGAPLGRKRMYAAADRTLSVNVAPYLRTLLDPVPMSAAYRTAPVRIVVSGSGVTTYTSPYVNLAGGRDDLAVNEILSASPADVLVAPTDFDEIALVTAATVQPEVVFVRNGATYTDSSMDDVSSKEMIAVQVDVARCILKAAVKAGIHTNFVDKFTLRLRLTSGGVVTTLERRYTIDRTPRRGLRVAWINRYGAVDFHTFPVIEKIAHRHGEKVRTLISEPVDVDGAVWLAEILDSPTVWQMDGSTATPIDVIDGAVVISPVVPTYVTLAVKPRN